MCSLYSGCPYTTPVSHSPWSVFSSWSITTGNSLKRSDTIIGQLQASGHPLLVLLSAFPSPFWMTGQLDDWSHGFVLLYTTQCSINRDACKSSYMIQCSYSSFLYLCFSFEPHIGCQFILHSGSLCDWV